MSRHFPGKLAALLLAAGFLLLSGCASIFNENAGDILTPTPAPVEVVPQRGGDLFIAVPSDIRSFDPITAVNEDLINFLTLIYECPFVYNEDGRLEECLIDTWEVSESGTEYLFHLRQDICFSDGEQLTAADVVATASRILGRTAMRPEDSAGDGEDSSQPAWQTSLSNRYGAYNHDILSVDAEDAFTVSVTLHEAGNAALYFMTFPVTKADFSPRDLPCGTGPYMVESYTEGEQAVLVINELWWQEAPYLDRIVANAVNGPSETMELLETSILDFVTTNAVNSGNYNLVGQWQVIDYMTNYYDCLVPNLDRPKLRNVSIRRAISDALDRRELLSTVLLNHGVPSLLPIAPDFYAVDAKYRSGQSDPSEALRLLGEAGYRTEEADEEEQTAPALQLRLIVPDTMTSTYKREAARAIKKQLERVFIEVEIAELGEEDYMTALMEGDFDLAYCSYYLSEVPNLAFMFDENGAGNYGHVYDPQLQEAIGDVGKAVTEEEMMQACIRLQERLSALMPQIGLYFRMNSIICDEGIHGITDVRQNAVFASVSRWYNSYFAQTVPQDSASPTPTISQIAASSGLPSASASAAASASFTGGPASDPPQPDSS